MILFKYDVASDSEDSSFIDLDELLYRPIPSLLDIIWKETSGDLSTRTMKRHAVTADAMSWTTRISTVAILLVDFFFAFHTTEKKIIK